MNHIEMCHVCSECDLDCEAAHSDGSCPLADLPTVPPYGAIREVSRS